MFVCMRADAFLTCVPILSLCVIRMCVNIFILSLNLLCGQELIKYL